MNRLFILFIIGTYLFMMSCNSDTQKKSAESMHSKSIKEDHDHDHQANTHDHQGSTHNHQESTHDHQANTHDHQANTHDHQANTHDHQANTHDHQGNDHDHEEHSHDHGDHDEHMHGASNNEAALKEYLSKRIIKTKKIYPEEFQEVIKTYGKVLPSPDQTLSIVAGSNGTVSFNKNLLSAGFFSNKNAQLFSIKAKGIENNPVIKIQSAQEEYNKQKSKYDRALKLVGDKIMSRSEFENIEADYRIAKATLEAYKKEYSSNKEIIRAPVSGTIDKILVNPGDYVEAGQILAEIRTNNRVQIKAELNTNSIESISAIESALIKTSNGDLYKTSDYNGVRTNTGNIALENNFLPVYFTMDQPDRLIIGDFLEVFLYGKKKENTIMIPNSSIMEEQGQYYVFIRHGVTDFHKTYITKGISDAEHTEVLTGIKAGDIIVSEGTVIVKLATQTSNMPASTHSH